MPKIIPDIDERIEASALALFNAYDYNQVDMKMIAKNCHIAVGTLYNYYPNKRQLFIHILRKTWHVTAISLDEVYQTYALPEEKLSHSIEVLYDDSVQRRGMVKHIYKILSGLESDDEMLELFDLLFSRVVKLFQPFEKKSFSCNQDMIDDYLAKSLILIIQKTIIANPTSREDNLHFIQDFFYNSLHVDIALKKNYLKTH
ncbi:MAG: TetR/AcrR family transcriptional regulator [Cellulosilyticaceae bacterium]